MSAKIDMTGKRIGRLTVICEHGRQGKKVTWLCRCDCGKEVVATGDNLRRGQYKSCGCYSADRLRKMRSKHKMSNSRIYKEWSRMRQRCYYERYIDYHCYGGRGITVCDEWLFDFENFKDWAMANGYDEKLTLDRIDTNKGYSPGNCRWVSQKVQANNKRNNHRITFRGITMTLAQWAEETGLNYGCLKSRINNLKWSVEDALTIPSGWSRRKLSKA